MFRVDYPFIQNFLSQKRNIIITTHKTPDGDALGSSLALLHVLKTNHNVNIIVPNDYPHYLKWMPGNDDVLIYEENEEHSDSLINQSDLIFCLDFNKLYRVDTMFNVLNNNNSYKIMIDHHQDPDSFCDQILSDSSVASTAELIYDFLSNLDYCLDKDIATCLYTGIVTDTGSFKYPNVTKKTHEIISALLHFNINHSFIHQQLFDSQNQSRLLLLKRALETLKLFKHQKTALTFLTAEDLLNADYKKGDTEGFVNMPLSLNDIMFSAFFIEFKDGIKMSFRSQGDFNVNVFAKKYFNGGGHKNAAGGVLMGKKMVDAIQYFSDVLDSFSNEI
tara:strand:+ start:10541 stop:11539 length:999 start_codon:yes stop_codon:yes gene_type:complete